MQTTRSTPPRFYFFAIGTLALLLLGFALYIKGDVKARFKLLGIEFSIDAKDRASNQKH